MPSMAKVKNIYTWNVTLGLATGVSYCLGYGLFQQTVLPSFILFVGGSNLAIGFAEGLQGIATLVSALPAGYLADRYSRSSCIRLGAVIWVISCGCLIATVAIAEPGSSTAYFLLCLALALEGICDGIINGPLVALMDDSVPAGYRSDVETLNSVACTAANSVGPLLAAAMFMHSGNNWSIHGMKTVIVTGCLIGQLSNVFGVFMDDKKALGEDSEAVHLQEGLLDNVGGEQGQEKTEEEVDKTAGGKRTFFGLVGPSSVIYLMFVQNCVMALGAGMTIKFFPVFFQQECQVSPATLNLVFAVLGGFTVVAQLLAQKLAKKFGRLQIIIPATILGVLATGLLGAMKPMYTDPYVMIPLFMTRCTVMWSIGAIKGSIVADYTPKATRGRWKALNSITAAGWSGSAAVGGWLIDHYGYGPCFMITAIFQGTSIPLLFLMLPHVAKETDLADAIDRRHLAEGEAAVPTPKMTPGRVATFHSPGGTRNRARSRGNSEGLLGNESK